MSRGKLLVGVAVFVAVAVAVSSGARAEVPEDPPTDKAPAAAEIRGGIGSARGIGVRPPQSSGVTIGQVREPTMQATRVGLEAVDGKADDALLVELAQKQMRRNQRLIEACTRAAQKRNVSGTVMLAVAIDARKVARVEVVGDTMSDALLNECLVESTAHWQFSVPHAVFKWQVDVEPRTEPPAKKKKP